MPAPTEIAANLSDDVVRNAGDVAALAPAHAADLRGIDPALGDQVVDAREHVPRVADAEVADVQLAELLAVAGAAAVVDLENQRPARRPDVGRVVARVGRQQRRPIDAGRAAVDDAQQRVLLRRDRNRPA